MIENTNKEFQARMYQSLLEEAKKQGIKNPEVIAQLGTAQSSLETGYGRHAPGGNYFGIKGGAGPAQQTQEFINGKMVTVQDKFREYGSMQESAADYIAFLKRNPRYKNVLDASTIEEAITAQGLSGYATDPNYAAKLGSIAGVTPAASISAAKTTTGASPATTRGGGRGGSGLSSSPAAASGERKRKNKKSAKKRIRGELDKLFDKKTGIPKARDVYKESKTTAQQILSDTTEKRKVKRGSNPGKVIANVIKSLRNVSKQIKTNNQQIISSIDKSVSQLSSLKDKSGMLVGGSDNIFAEMIKPQEFSIGDQSYLYYPGGPEGRQVYEKGRKGTAGKIAPREIQKQYAKRKDVDVLHKSDLGNVLNQVKFMLDNDTAIRKTQFNKLMDYIDAGGNKSSSSVFNLEADEQAAIMEKALTAALENIYKKHPELLGSGGGGAGGVGINPSINTTRGTPTPTPTAPGGVLQEIPREIPGGKPSPTGVFGRIAATAKTIYEGAKIFAKRNPEALAATAAVGAVSYMAGDLDKRNQQILNTSEDPNEISGILMQPYLMSSPDAVIPDNVQKDIGNQAEKIAKQNKVKNEAMKTAEKYANSPEYQNELKRTENMGLNPSMTPISQALPIMSKVWTGSEWVNKQDNMKPTYQLSERNLPAGDAIIDKNVQLAEEKDRQYLLREKQVQRAAPAVAAPTIINNNTNVVKQEDSIPTDVRDGAFKAHVHGDGTAFVVPTW